MVLEREVKLPRTFFPEFQKERKPKIMNSKKYSLRVGGLKTSFLILSSYSYPTLSDINFDFKQALL